MRKVSYKKKIKSASGALCTKTDKCLLVIHAVRSLDKNSTE